MSESAELIVALIGCLIAEGMDVREAILEVGEKRVADAMMNAPAKSEAAGRLLACLSVKSRMDSDDKDMEQALELTAAGWTAEDPRAKTNLPPPKNIWETTAVMSWQWRAPGKRPGKPGRLYLSTNQAFMALQRERGQ